MKVTIKDVAKLAGVSDTTVSLAFKPNSRISKKTGELVFAAAKQLNYTPNLAAKNLRAGKSDTIGFIVNDISNPFYALMLKEAEKSLEAAGFDMFAASSSWDAAKELKLIEKMLQMRVRGVIICFSEKEKKSMELLRQYNLPHIAVDSFPDEYDGNYIANDFNACGKIMADHFAEIGAQKPGIITAGTTMNNFSAFKKIFTSFRKNLKTHGLEVSNNNTINAGLAIASGRSAFKTAQQQSSDADAFFCANDLCALGFMEAAEAAGINIGRDLALAGIDDIEISSFSKLSLTSIQQPYSTIAQDAVSHLLATISGSINPVKKELAPTLKIRKSTSLKRGPN